MENVSTETVGITSLSEWLLHNTISQKLYDLVASNTTIKYMDTPVCLHNGDLVVAKYSKYESHDEMVNDISNGAWKYILAIDEEKFVIRGALA